MEASCIRSPCPRRTANALVMAAKEMSQLTRAIEMLLDRLNSTDKDVGYKAFIALIAATNKPVSWANEAWNLLIDLTKNGDNHQRAIGVQLLANLTKSDREARMLKDIDKLIAVTRDERFVTARHSLLCLWKVGAKDRDHQRIITRKLAQRFEESISEKNCTLIRYDILTFWRKIYDITGDEEVRLQAGRLIETEENLKYKKKYDSLWR